MNSFYIYVMIICRYCKKEFIPSNSHRFFCSFECANQFSRKNQKELYWKNREQILQKKQKKRDLILISVKRNCKYCGIEFVVKCKNQLYCCKEHTNLNRMFVNRINRQNKRQQESFHNKLLIEAREKYKKTGEIDHKTACMLISCNPGIELLQKISKEYGIYSKELEVLYRNLEKLLYQLNCYPNFSVKVALALYLKTNLTQKKCIEICDIPIMSITNLLKRVKPYIK